MHISVRYTPDLMLSVRLYLYLLRKFIWALAIFGTLLIVFGVAAIGSKSLAAGIFLIALGVVLILEIPVLLWLMVYRNRKVFLSEVEVTLTSEGIESRTDTTTINLTWDKLQRIHELERHLGLRREQADPHRRGEAGTQPGPAGRAGGLHRARGLDRRVRKMTPAQEAAYSLAYGITRQISSLRSRQNMTGSWPSAARIASWRGRA